MLLERLPQGIRLTAAGAALLPEARAAAAAAARAGQAARRSLGLESGELELGATISVAFGLLPPVIQAWHQRYPQVGIRLREYDDVADLADAVRRGMVDFAISRRPVDWQGPTEHLGWDTIVVVLPPQDPLARTNKRVSLKAMADRDWVLIDPERALGRALDAMFAEEGIVPRVAIRTSEVMGAPLLSAAGLGPALVPANVVPPGLHHTIRQLDPPRTREIVAFTRTSWSPPATALFELIRERPWPRRPRGAQPVIHQP
jgi:DNA-binding transcriptional LysR family regulator